MRIILVGGGTGGSVSPLLAVAEEIKINHPKASFLFIGTKTGPERQMAEGSCMEFKSISAGKFRRYFSLANLASPFLVLGGFWQSVKILKEFKPDCVFGTGSFVQVPLIWAAKFLGIPSVIHQQDIVPSLANTLCQHAVSKITVTFEDSLTDFSSGLGLFYKKKKKDKIYWTGNPFRHRLAEAVKEKAIKSFGLKNDFPTLFVIGGGTGAAGINKILLESLPELTKTVQVIHATGKNKPSGFKSENYHPFEFISNVGEAFAASDIVLSRAGLSTITELSNLKKISIIVPMPDSHQEMNALLMMQQNAAIVVPQNKLTPKRLVMIVRKLLFEPDLQKALKKNIGQIMPKDSGKKIASIITEEVILKK